MIENRKFHVAENSSYTGWYVAWKKTSNCTRYLHKDLKFHRNTEFSVGGLHERGTAPGYWMTEMEAQIALSKYFLNQQIERGQSMITLSNGVEISEDTIVSALKKAGIAVEPKHIFAAGDVARGRCGVRIIASGSSGLLTSYDLDGATWSTGQKSFEDNSYKYLGKLRDMINLP